MKKLLLPLFASLTVYNAVAQPPGNAFSFDGDNDIFLVPNQAKFNFTSAVTLEAWVRRNGSGDWSHIVSKNTNTDYWCLRRSGSSNRVCFNAANAEVTSTTQLATGVWYHLAGVYDGTSSKLYVNGVLEASTTAVNASLSASTSNIYIGGTTWNNRCWNGCIDEVRIWNTALSEATIRANMYNTISASSSGLVAYYQFDQGTPGVDNTSVTTLTDATSSPANGSKSPSNIALTGATSNWVESYAMVVPAATAGTPGGNRFWASWTAPAIGTVNNYVLDVSTNAAFSSFVPGYNGLSVSGTNYQVSGLSLNTTYYYRLRANKTSVTGQGGYSNTITINTGSVLPVTWLSFTAEQQNGHVQLAWSTAAETSAKDYVVQHSTDGHRWTDISTILAAGNSSSVRQYTYKHDTPSSGDNYYRLLQRDVEGQSSFSTVVTVSAAQNMLFEVLTNPVTNGNLRLRIYEPGTLKLYHNSGRLVWQQKTEQGVQTIPVANLGKGLFMVQMNGRAQQVIIQ